MGNFILKRSPQSVLSLLLLIVLVFFLARMTGSPASLYLPPEASLAQLEAFNELHGFNDPLIVQFGRFASGLQRFDLGDSRQFSRPALEVVLQAFRPR